MLGALIGGKPPSETDVFCGAEDSSDSLTEPHELEEKPEVTGSKTTGSENTKSNETDSVMERGFYE